MIAIIKFFNISFFSCIKKFKYSSARKCQKDTHTHTKKKIQKKPHDKHQNLSKEDINKKQQHSCKQLKNLPEDEKQRLVEYSKKSHKTWKEKLFHI